MTAANDSTGLRLLFGDALGDLGPMTELEFPGAPSPGSVLPGNVQEPGNADSGSEALSTPNTSDLIGPVVPHAKLAIGQHKPRRRRLE